MQRASVTGSSDCKKYIVQNNNWAARPAAPNHQLYRQQLHHQEQQWQRQQCSGIVPSVYIGANGDLANDTYNTWSDSGLPKKLAI